MHAIQLVVNASHFAGFKSEIIYFPRWCVTTVLDDDWMAEKHIAPYASYLIFQPVIFQSNQSQMAVVA